MLLLAHKLTTHDFSWSVLSHMICSQRINPPSVSFVGRSSCHGCSVKEKAGESGDSLPILTKVTIFLTSVDEKGKRESYSIGTRRGKLTLRSPLSNGHLV